ncbi:hypothetical protein [Phenylobacterium sp. J367]|uniref:hypothetical protein n=1 Tax=Phenylobacterium sp. J367 TaxID=2898435 RepID=UPI002151274E|nr:hypothetical protein [Phenylobacterium sp. J367]MCR5878525.1 hypothetical protein [Phenylobacterium sp. J367]
MTRQPDQARKARRAVRVRIARGLARCRRALARRRLAEPAPPLPESRPFVFPDLRVLHRQELLRLERDQFPMWRPDYEKVRALQSCA